MRTSEHQRRVALSRWANTRERDRAAFGGSEVAVARAALCGFLAGDGSIKRREVKLGITRYDLNCYPDDEEMLSVYLEYFRKVYGKTPNVKRMKNFYYVQCSNRAIGEDLMKLSMFGITNWRIPSFETLEEKIAWLRAFFSAEGYVGVKSVRVQTVNEHGMKQVSMLLSELGIHHGCYVYTPKNENILWFISLQY